jgi:hypothetical protein
MTLIPDLCWWSEVQMAMLLYHVLDMVRALTIVEWYSLA